MRHFAMGWAACFGNLLWNLDGITMVEEEKSNQVNADRTRVVALTLKDMY
jgi:hypothetical protein